MKEAKDQHIPDHIAIIMDGNGRWAENKGLARSEGHAAGVRHIEEILKHANHLGVKYLTLYAFSTENWQRPVDEVTSILSLIAETIACHLDEIVSHGIKVKFLGDLESFDEALRRQLQDAEFQTKNNQKMQVNLALNYGGRAEIMCAIKKLIQSRAEVTEENFKKTLATAGMPDPDLLIRTSGECRISNFLLWQIAYTELYFTDTLWPDFDCACFDAAITEFQKRSRRYGKV